MSQSSGRGTVFHIDQGGPAVHRRTEARRRFLVRATATLGLTGAGLAAWPFLASWRPSARARARGGPVRVDITKTKPGAQVTVIWRGHPVWILRRAPDTLDHVSHPKLLERLRDPDSEVDTQQPPYAQNPTRSIEPQYLVVDALCTHLGCVPTFRPEVGSTTFEKDWMGGYFCACHGSKFDLAGRVYKSVPAPINLVVPPYRFLEPALIEIGVDQDVSAT